MMMSSVGTFGMGETAETSDDVDVVWEARQFEEFYRTSYQRVARALVITLRDPDLAAEATDEAMVRAYLRWDKLRSYDSPEGWAYRVGLNWANSLRRKLSRRLPFRVLDGRATEVTIEPALEEALRELSLDMRSVIVCRYLLDWSIESTATALQIRQGTVKSRTSRALDILAVRLQHLK